MLWFHISVKLTWKNQIKYLGIFILASRSFKINLQPAKQKFFRATNGVLGKIISTKNPAVTLSLLHSFCVPILFYGLEAIHLRKAERDSIDFAYNSLFVKIFNIKDKVLISNCQYYTGYLPASYVLDLKIIKFQNSIQTISNSIVCIIDMLVPSSERKCIAEIYTGTQSNWQSFLNVSQKLRKGIMFDVFQSKLAQR